MAVRRAAFALLALPQLAQVCAYQSAEPALEAALDLDDQCGAGDAESCALNALQLRARASAEAEAEAEAGTGTETETTGDIRQVFFKYYNSSLHKLKPYIAGLYKEVGALDRQANWTMKVVAESMNVSSEGDTGLVWEHGAKKQKHPHNTKYLRKLPPRTRYVAFEADYLQQLMVRFWEQYTKVGRMYYGVLNVLPANEDGPKVAVGCVDLDASCKAWAKGGSCMTHSTFMSSECPCICDKLMHDPKYFEHLAAASANETANETAPSTADETAPAELLEASAGLEEDLAALEERRSAMAALFERVFNDWGSTTLEREDHTKELYKALVLDIKDGQNKTKIMKGQLKAMNSKVQGWLAKKP